MSNGIGGAIIIWQDFRNGDPDIFAQGIGSNGSILMIPANGVPICTAVGFQYGAAYSSPTIVSDGSNGAIITWYDDRNLNGILDVYAQNIKSNGLVAWAQDGLPISTVANGQYAPTILATGGGEAIICWVDSRNGNTDIYASKIEQSVSSTGSICGIKYNDLNGNGVKDIGDLGLANWTMSLTYNDVSGAPVTITTTTDASGNYCFNNLSAGTYFLSEVNQTGWVETYPSPGAVYGIALLSGQVANIYDFGNHQLSVPGSICGQKFNDLNGNGVQDSGDIGIANWTINLTYNLATGPVTINATTDSNGNYCFNNLASGGTYRVWETQQSGWTQTYPVFPGTYSVLLASGQNVIGDNFGNHQQPLPGSICGQKFNDLNGNGIQDSGDIGIANWTINLSYFQATGPVTLTAITDSNGNYCFNNLASGGTYTVSEVQQTGWTQTFPASPGTYSVLLTSGQNVTGDNFGNHHTAVVNICDSLSAVATISTGGDCCWSISLNQPTNTSGITGVQFLPLAPNSFVLGSSQLGSSFSTGWLIVSNIPNQFTIRRQSGNIPVGQLNNFFNFCLNNLSSPQHVVVDWLNASNGIVCSDTVTLNCDIPCVTYQNKLIACANNNSYTLQYAFTNNTTFAINKIEVVQTIPAGVTVTPATVNIPSVLSGQNSGIETFTITGAVPNTNLTIFFRYTSSDGCCTCTDSIHVRIPDCLCDAIGATLNQDLNNCNHTLNVFNNYSANYFTQINIIALTSGTTFSNWNTNTGSDWYSTNTFAANNIRLVNIGNGFVPLGNLNGILNFNLSGYTTTTQQILVEWIRNDSVKCVDTLTTHCIPSPPVMYCTQLIDESMVCLANGTFEYKFKVKNNSSNTTTGFQLNPVSPLTMSFSLNNFSNISIAPSMISPEQTVIISGVGQNTQMCFGIALYTHIIQNGTLYSWCCHSDTICVTTPVCGNQSSSICGQKFNDLNGNAVKDSGESGLANWIITIKIQNVAGWVIIKDTTDVNGNYCFNNLQAGTYTVSEINQSGWMQTYPANPGTHTVILTAGQNVFGIDFGNKQLSCVKAWTPLTSGTNGEVWALAVIGSDLYVGGNFTTAGGNTANHIAKWDGSAWSPLISSNSGVDGINGMVTALTVIGTDLYAGGWFTDAGGVPALNVAKWDGLNWSSLGSGISAAGAINALTAMGNNIYATTYILDPILGGQGHIIAKWDGSNWSNFSTMNDYVSSFLVDGGNLYAGGQFTMIGNVPANHIAKWDGTAWSALGVGTDFFIGGAGLEMLGGKLYVGGRFLNAGGSTANFIANWNGTAWSSFGSGSNIGMNNEVECVKAMGGDLYASGSFTTAQGVSANSIAKWDGLAWTSLGTGMNDGVWRLAVVGSDLYAGGIFTTAGSVSANYIARYSCTGPNSLNEPQQNQKYDLIQNQPNPFNSTTIIKYYVPETGLVKLSVYDIFGKEINVLVSEVKESGSYERIFEAKGLMSGIYFYTISTNGFTQSRKMLLIK
ncbi:MAG: SdrD B-like domain-containing protein [Paludibacter sp.]